MISPPRKFVVGTAPYFYWIAPGPPISSNPAIIFRSGATTLLSGVMAQAAVSSAVSAVSDDRTELTVAAATGSARQGLVGEWLGRCALYLNEGGSWIPVTVQRFRAETIAVLAEPLPHDVTIAAGSILETLVFYRALLAADVTAALVRNVHWTVTYSVAMGVDAPGRTGLADGFIHIVRRPFDTGLTHAKLLRRVPEFARTFPDRQESWEPQIEVALEELEADILARLDYDKYADDLLGEQFEQAHSFLTASNILESRTGGRVVEFPHVELPADSYRQRYLAALDGIFKRLQWLDLDGDGLVDADEANLASEALPTIEYVDSYYRTSDFDTTLYPKYERGSKH